MIKIKLQRKGVRNKAFYRIVAMDHKNKLSGKAVENLGYWQPSKDLIKIDKDKVKSWVDKGAQITPAVADLIKK